MTATAPEATPFYEAIRSAQAVVEEREAEVVARARQEAIDAVFVARQYAAHLAGGGDPPKVPGGSNATRYSGVSALVPDMLALIVVYRAWNEARGSRNPILPFRNERSWRVSEVLFSRFGEPIPYAELAQAGQVGSKYSSPELVRLLRDVADETRAEIVPRKTKVDGKVAYLIRERRDGDPDVFDDDDRYGGGRWRSGVRGGSDIPEEGSLVIAK